MMQMGYSAYQHLASGANLYDSSKLGKYRERDMAKKLEEKLKREAEEAARGGLFSAILSRCLDCLGLVLEAM